jgi:hypothetical protein
LQLECLEGRLTPSPIPVGPTTADLINAIITADNTSGPVVLSLPLKATYQFTAPNNYWYGPNALPHHHQRQRLDHRARLRHRARSFVTFTSSPRYFISLKSQGATDVPRNSVTNPFHFSRRDSRTAGDQENVGPNPPMGWRLGMSEGDCLNRPKSKRAKLAPG